MTSHWQKKARGGFGNSNVQRSVGNDVDFDARAGKRSWFDRKGIVLGANSPGVFVKNRHLNQDETKYRVPDI